MAPKTKQKPVPAPIATPPVRMRRPGEIPPWRRITVQEIASTESMLLEYDDWMRLPFTQLLLGALEQAIKPITPPFKGMDPSNGLARHMYQCGSEDVLKLIRNLDQLNNTVDVGEPLYGSGTLEEFMDRLTRNVDVTGVAKPKKEE